MYIKVNNSSQVVNMDDYVLINDLTFHMRNVELSALKDGDNYYTKDEIQNIIDGELSLNNFITSNDLTNILKGYMTDFTMFYMQTDDAENEPDVNDASWSESITNWQNDKFVWQLVEINKPGLIIRSTPVCISGPYIPEEEEEIPLQLLIDVRPQWCFNNDGNWMYEIDIPSEYDEVWMRNELVWKDPDEFTYTEGVRDQVYEKVKELISRLVVVEDDVNILKTDVEDINLAIDEIKETTVTKEDYQKLIDYDDSNLLENGNFFNRTASWVVYGTGNNVPRLQEKVGYPHGRAIVFQGEVTHVQYIYQPAFPLTNIENVEYTFSCMVQADDAMDGYDEPFCGLIINVDYIDETSEEFISEVEILDGTWNKIYTTFTVPKVVEKFECYFYVRDTEKVVRVSELMLAKGDIVGPFKSNPIEIFNNAPKYLSDLDNDMNFITEEEVLDMISNIEAGNGGNIDLSGYALIEDIPIKLSELENDMDFLMEVPEEYVTEDELKNEITELKNEIAELKQIIAGLSNYVTLDVLNQRLDNLTVNVVTEDEYNALEQEEDNTLYLIDLDDDENK